MEKKEEKMKIKRKQKKILQNHWILSVVPKITPELILNTVGCSKEMMSSVKSQTGAVNMMTICTKSNFNQIELAVKAIFICIASLSAAQIQK